MLIDHDGEARVLSALCRRGLARGLDFSRHDVAVRASRGLRYFAFGHVHSTGHRWYFAAALLVETSTVGLAAAGNGTRMKKCAI